MNVLGLISGQEVAGGGSSRSAKVRLRERVSGGKRGGADREREKGFPKMETLGLINRPKIEISKNNLPTYPDQNFSIRAPI